jgi:hypothetical protein
VGTEPHVRRDALELIGEDGVQALVLARLDDERQPREPWPRRFAVNRWAGRVHRRHCVVSLGWAGRPPRSAGSHSVSGARSGIEIDGKD